MKYPGTRWYKCDFHLHTTASSCFTEQSITPEQWVDKAIDNGLDCVAVTDHNTGAGIDGIIEASREKSLIIFPGVEITCDSSKVHLLIIFDTNKCTQDIEDFLIDCGIQRQDFGAKDAHSTLRIQDIIEKATSIDCVVIPAHIDQFSGLSSVSHATVKDLYQNAAINAVQVVHQEFLLKEVSITGNEDLQTAMKGFYGQEISESELRKWHGPVKQALEQSKTLLTFSDNPESSTSSQHGLNGIGEKYTWIKMEEKPSLASLRQAFLLSNLRVRHCFDSPNQPYSFPELWIRRIKINNTEVTSLSDPLTIEFSPQLNTIIGGRGSGKSGILRFLRGLFNKTLDMSDDILADQNNFYKKQSRQEGVLKEDSEVEILFERQGKQYQLKATNITDSLSQNIEIHKLTDRGWEEVTNEGFLDFFEFEQYSQKQIYDIAQKTQSLRARIDTAAEGMSGLKNDKDTLVRQYLETSTKMRTAESLLEGKAKLETEITDLAEQIKIFEEGAIASLLATDKNFQNEDRLITAPLDDLKDQTQLIEELIPEIIMEENDFSEVREEYREEIKAIHDESREIIVKLQQQLLSLQSELQEVETTYKAKISKTKWQVAFACSKNDFDTKKQELKEKGIDEIDSYEKLSLEKKGKDSELLQLTEAEGQLTGLKTEQKDILKEYQEKLEEISDIRKQFVEKILEGENVKIVIKSFRDKESFETQFRNCIDRESGFQADIDTLASKVFTGHVPGTIKEFQGIILDLAQGKSHPEISGHLANRIQAISSEAVDRLMLLMPEDEISIRYKPTGSSSFKPLATASAGQKTTAILTFIMSHGECPLILDQPEDDLDNRLVYELVVDRLKKAKEKRQIIVVTHNANIPVNGDAEQVISMDSDSCNFKVLASGSVDQQAIKKEICDVMEGTEYAFNMRAKRYQDISS